MTTEDPAPSDDVVDLIRQLDGRIRVLEKIKDPILRDEVFVMLRLIDSLHRTLLGKLAARLRETAIWDAVLEDADLATLFGLYDLAPLAGGDLEDDPDDPGGDAVGDAVNDAVNNNAVHNAVDDAAGDAPSRDAAVPSFAGETIRPQRPPGSRKLPVVNGPVLQEIARLSELADGSPIVVATAGVPALLVRIGEAVYACAPSCPSCGGSLADGVVSNSILVCPMRNCAFDVRSGRRADGPTGPGLRVFPLTVRDGRVLLAVGVAAQVAWG